MSLSNKACIKRKILLYVQMTERARVEYDFSTNRIIPLNIVGMGLEVAQNIPNIHDVMPEPFDITNHAATCGSVLSSRVALV
jgi:hypothetical protein